MIARVKQRAHLLHPVLPGLQPPHATLEMHASLRHAVVAPRNLLLLKGPPLIPPRVGGTAGQCNVQISQFVHQSDRGL